MNQFIRLKDSVFFRIAIIFFAVIIPIYGIGIGLFNYGRAVIEAEIISQNRLQLSAYLEGFEKDIDRIRRMLYDTINDTALNTLALNYDIISPYERVVSILQLQERLDLLQDSNPYTGGVSAYIRAPGIVVSSRYGYRSMTAEQHHTYFDTIQIDAVSLGVLDGRICLWTRYPVYFNGRKSEFVVEVELSQGAIRSALAAQEERVEAIFLFDWQDRFVLSSGRKDAYLSQVAAMKAEVDDWDGAGYHIASTGTQDAFVFGQRSTQLELTAITYSDYQALFATVEQFKFYLMVFLVVSLLLALVIAMAASAYVRRPLQQLMRSFSGLEVGALDVKIDERKTRDEFHYLFKGYNHMIDRLSALIEQNYTSKLLHQKAELRQLQSQIAPHFLYNSFFILETMVARGENEAAKRFTRLLGEYFQYITRSSADEVPLEDEMRFAQVYSEIQGVRFANRVRIRFDPLPPSMARLPVPRLVVQPLLENAFKYGVEPSAEENTISVSYRSSRDTFQIVVENSGASLSGEQLQSLSESLGDFGTSQERTGLVNIHYRLRLRFGDGAGLAVFGRDGGGIRVVLTLPGAESDTEVMKIEEH